MYVYFIYSQPHIKIGFSKDPNKRLAQMQTASGQLLQLIGYIKGGREQEKDIHRQLETHHVRGEWYKASPVLDFIASIEPSRWVRLNPADLKRCPRRCKWGHVY